MSCFESSIYDPFESTVYRCMTIRLGLYQFNTDLCILDIDIYI